MSGGIKVTIIDIQTPPAAGGRNGVGLSGWTATGGACCFCSAGDARSPCNSFFSYTQTHGVAVAHNSDQLLLMEEILPPLWDV